MSRMLSLRLIHAMHALTSNGCNCLHNAESISRNVLKLTMMIEALHLRIQLRRYHYIGTWCEHFAET